LISHTKRSGLREMQYCARTDQAESEQNCSLQAIIGVENIEAALAALMSRPQRMVCRNPRLQTNITEETFRSLILAAPPLSTGGLNAPTHLSTESYPHVKITTLNSVFQQPASETQLAAQSVQRVTVMVVKTEEIGTSRLETILSATSPRFVGWSQRMRPGSSTS
jgi:hypothetical protein